MPEGIVPSRYSESDLARDLADLGVPKGLSAGEQAGLAALAGYPVLLYSGGVPVAGYDTVAAAVAAAVALQAVTPVNYPYLVFAKNGVSRDFEPAQGVIVIFEEDAKRYSNHTGYGAIEPLAPRYVPFGGSLVAVRVDDGNDTFHTEYSALGAHPSAGLGASTRTYQNAFEYARDAGVPMTLGLLPTSSLYVAAGRLRLRDLIYGGCEVACHSVDHSAPDAVDDFWEQTFAWKQELENMVLPTAWGVDPGYPENGRAGIKVRGWLQPGPWTSYLPDSLPSGFNLLSMQIGADYGRGCTFTKASPAIRQDNVNTTNLTTDDAIIFDEVEGPTNIVAGTTYYIKSGGSGGWFQIAASTPTSEAPVITLNATGWGRFREVGVDTDRDVIRDGNGEFGMLLRGAFDWSAGFMGSFAKGKTQVVGVEGGGSMPHYRNLYFQLDATTWNADAIARLLALISATPGLRVCLAFHKISALGEDGVSMPIAGFKALIDGLKAGRDAGTLAPVTMSTLMSAVQPASLYDSDTDEPVLPRWGGVTGGYIPDMTWAQFIAMTGWAATSITPVIGAATNTPTARPGGAAAKVVRLDCSSQGTALTIPLNVDPGREHLLRYDICLVSGTAVVYEESVKAWYRRRNRTTGAIEWTYRSLEGTGEFIDSGEYGGLYSFSSRHRLFAAEGSWKTAYRTFLAPDWAEFCELDIRIGASKTPIVELTNLECVQL